MGGVDRVIAGDTNCSETRLQVPYKTTHDILVCVRSTYTMQQLFNVTAM